MGNPNEFDRELLSARLDDALTGAELSRADQLLATNPGAAQYFARLRSTRERLKSVPSSKLRSSLAARVLEQARAQALAEGLPSDHHVLRAAEHNDSLVAKSVSAVLADRPSDSIDLSDLSDRTVADQVRVIPSTHIASSARTHWSSRRVAWAALAAAAAVIAGVAIVPRLTSVNQPQDTVAELAPQAAEAAPHTANEPSPIDSIAASDAGSVPYAATAENSLPTLDSQRPERRQGEVAHVMRGSGAEDALKSDLAAPSRALDFMMIIDAVVSTEGWESGRFEQLLEELGIPIASPIVADQNLIQVLEETRVVVGSADADRTAQQPRAALVYVRAGGATLDRLFQAMHQDGPNFPQVVTDVSIDQGSRLHKLLRGQSTGRQQQGPTARVLSAAIDVGSPEDVVPQFVPAQRSRMTSSGKSSTASAGNLPGLNVGGDASMSEAIVILREPK